MKRITFISTVDDGSCGIGTYTGELRSHFPGSIRDELVPVELASPNPVDYLQAALSVTLAETDVIHVQHEYGIYGPKSIMSWLFFPILYLAARLRRIPVVITMHSAWNSDTIRPPLVGLKRIYVALNNRLLAITADHLIFLSENGRDLFIDSVAVEPEDYSVVAHGVPTTVVDMDQENAKSRFGYDADDTVIVEPGYIREEKGSDRFVRFASELPEYEFLLAGGVPSNADDGFLDELRRESPGNVQITGILEDDRFQAVFNATDLIILPYRAIHQSGVFNWCVAHELPVLASDIEYFQKLCTKHGCVCLLPAENATEIITDLIENTQRREELIANMRSYKRSRTMDEVAREHVETYDRLLRRA